ncbi:MAG: NAD(P)/FAD-dependent oxidoreductase [Thioalkalispiraceae bacterium]|jgi:geranylgeranyl reductase family protein
MTEVVYDVLIVGGGPAGSTLAWSLRDSGLKIAVLDKQTFPRDKVCAGWVTPAVMEELQLDLEDYRQTRTLQPIYGFRVSHMGKREVETRYTDTPASYSIRRCEFDQYLLERSTADLILGEKFKSMSKTELGNGQQGWLLNDKYKAKLVVGAGGHFCPVVRQMGSKLGSSELIVAAQEIEFEMNEQQAEACPVEADVPELFFCDDLKGYGWVVRKGNFLNIGLGREDNHKLSEHVAVFRNLLIEQGKIPADTPEKFHGHAYLLYPHATRPLLKDGVLIIGDAAGLAYPESGEGIRPAVESSLIAAQVILQANGDYRQANLMEYKTELEARLGKREGKELMDFLPGWFKQSLAGVLLSTQWFVKNYVVEKWFLHSEQAPLLTDSK